MVSELRKGDRAHPGVRRWAADSREDQHFVSVITLGEIRYGIERLRRRDRARAGLLDLWLEELTSRFAHRVVPVDAKIVDLFGRLQAARTYPMADALLAATAKAYGMTLVTRNEKDFHDAGVEMLNPFLPT